MYDYDTPSVFTAEQMTELKVVYQKGLENLAYSPLQAQEWIEAVVKHLQPPMNVILKIEV